MNYREIAINGLISRRFLINQNFKDGKNFKILLEMLKSDFIIGKC